MFVLSVAISPSHWFRANELKNKCQKYVKHAKETYVTDEVEIIENDAKMFWLCMKKACSKTEENQNKSIGK